MSEEAATNGAGPSSPRHPTAGSVSIAHIGVLGGEQGETSGMSKSAMKKAAKRVSRHVRGSRGQG